MPMENQLAHAITQTEYDLSYDKAAKKLLANKQILAQIMKNCVNEYSACSVDEIAEKYIEGTPEVGTVGVHVDDTNRPKKTSDVIAGSNNEDSTLTEGTINYKLKKIITETVFDINAVVFYSTLGIAILMTIASVVIAKCRIVMFYVDQTQMSALFTTTAQIVGGLYGLTLTASSRCWACENSFYI